MPTYDDWKLASPREEENAEETAENYGFDDCPGLRSPSDTCGNEPCLDCPYYHPDQHSP